jgi:hypothetical protein
MSDSATDNNDSKRPSLTSQPGSANAGPASEPKRVLASLGGTPATGNPPSGQRRGSPGILASVVLLLAVGSASAWLLFRGQSPGDQAPAREPAVEIAAASPATEQAEMTPAPSEPVAQAQTETPSPDAAPPETARVVSSEPTDAPATLVTDATAPADQAITPAPAATPSSLPAAFSASKTTPSKKTKSRTGSKTKPKSKPIRATSKGIGKKTGIDTQNNTEKVDPDADVIEVLLRRGTKTSEASGAGTRNRIAAGATRGATTP